MPFCWFCHALAHLFLYSVNSIMNSTMHSSVVIRGTHTNMHAQAHAHLRAHTLRVCASNTLKSRKVWSLFQVSSNVVKRVVLIKTFGQGDDPEFLHNDPEFSYDNIDTMEEIVSHALHKASITILGILVGLVSMVVPFLSICFFYILFPLGSLSPS